MSYITINNISKNDKNIKFENFSINIKKNEIIAITNKKFGKALLDIISALDFNYENDVIVNDNNLKKLQNKELNNYRKSISSCLSSFVLLNGLNVEENINISNDKNISASLLKEYSLLKKRYFPINFLTKQEKNKVLFLRCIVKNTNIILIEDFLGSDLNSKIIKLLSRQNNKKCIIISTKNKDYLKYANKIINYEQGKITIKTNRKKEV